MPLMASISVDQFGPLLHGTGSLGVTELAQHAGGGPNYPHMMKSYGYNYATTDLQTAINYARTASRGGPSVVYEVTPRRKSDQWGPDPDSGPNGFDDGPRNKREALDIYEGGGEVSLRFRSPLKVKKEVWVEDKAKDVTFAGFNDRPTVYGGGRMSDFHTAGTSFS